MPIAEEKIIIIKLAEALKALAEANKEYANLLGQWKQLIIKTMENTNYTQEEVEENGTQESNNN